MSLTEWKCSDFIKKTARWINTTDYIIIIIEIAKTLTNLIHTQMTYATLILKHCTQNVKTNADINVYKHKYLNIEHTHTYTHTHVRARKHECTHTHTLCDFVFLCFDLFLPSATMNKEEQARTILKAKDEVEQDNSDSTHFLLFTKQCVGEWVGRRRFGMGGRACGSTMKHHDV